MSAKRLATVVALVVCSALVIPKVIQASVFECGGTEQNRDPSPCGTGWVWVTDDVFQSNPLFQSLFSVHVCWNYKQVKGDWRWGEAELLAFANEVINPTTGESKPHDILEYFGINEATEPDSITVSWGANMESTHFNIYLRDTSGYVYGMEDYVELHIDGGDGTAVLPAVVARDGFTHEWQHVCHQTWTQAGNVVHDFGGLHFNEMCSTLSQYMFGEDYPAGYDLPYDFSLVSSSSLNNHDYYSKCMKSLTELPNGSFGNCVNWAGNRYSDWAMFAIYLNNVYDVRYSGQGDCDVVYNWLRYQVGTNEYGHDLIGLGEVLMHSDLDQYFPGLNDPNERAKAALHNYQVAKFLNMQTNPPGGSLPAAQRVFQWSGAESPGDLYGFAVDSNGYYYDNAHSLPLYLEASSIEQEVGPTVYSCDLWPSECASEEGSIWWPIAEYVRFRYTEVTTYAGNYIVFYPSTSGSGGTLGVEFRFGPTYDCFKCDSGDPPIDYDVVDADYSGLEVVVNVLRYEGLGFVPAATPQSQSLCNHPELYSESTRYELHDLQGGDFWQFWVEDLDTDDAVAVVVSVVEDEVSDDEPQLRVVPYTYSYTMVPTTPDILTGVQSGSVEWGPNATIWILGDYEVPAGQSLTIREGTIVRACSEATRIIVNGTLNVAGTSVSPATFKVSNLPNYDNETWTGFVFGANSEIDLQHARVYAAGAISGDFSTGSFSAEDSHFTGDADEPLDVELLGGQVGGVTFAGCLFENLGRMALANAEMTGAQVAQALGAGTEPVIALVGGTCDVGSSSIQGNYAAIGIPDNTSAQTIVTLGPDLVLKAATPYPSSSIGVMAGENAACELSSSVVRDFETGLEFGSNSTLVMDNTLVYGRSFCLAVEGADRMINIGGQVGQTISEGRNTMIALDYHTDCRGVLIADDLCEEHSEYVLTGRVYNGMPSANVVAIGNYWGDCDLSGAEFGIDCICDSDDSFFAPDPQRVEYLPRLSSDYRACGGLLSAAIATDGGATAECLEFAFENNPAFGDVVLHFSSLLTEPRLAEISIYDVRGRCVRMERTLVRAGQAGYTWDGRDDSGRVAVSGVYLVRVSTSLGSRSKKVVIIR